MTNNRGGIFRMGASMPKDLYDEMGATVQAENLEYKGVSHFVQLAVREKLDRIIRRNKNREGRG